MTDRGGEYIDTLYFHSVGIIHETTALYTLQQNGISERKNKDAIFDENRFSSVPRPSLKIPIKTKDIGSSVVPKEFTKEDAIFDENRFSSVPRPSLKIPIKTKDIGSSVVPKEFTKEVVHQPKLELKKSKKNKTPKDFGPKFHIYLFERTKDEVSDQHSYWFNVKDGPKIFDKAMKSQDVSFWKEAIKDEMDSIMGNNTWCWLIYLQVANLLVTNGSSKEKCSTIRPMIAMASIHNLIIHQMDVKITFLNDDLDEEVELTKGLLSSKFSIKDIEEANVIIDIRIKHKMLEDYTDASWISNNEDILSTSGWVFLPGGGAISWASKKQPCITGSTIEYGFMALVAAEEEEEDVSKNKQQQTSSISTRFSYVPHYADDVTKVKSTLRIYNKHYLHFVQDENARANVSVKRHIFLLA
nr:hypothetical protein [Tanacetum cinerariifolium]